LIRTQRGDGTISRTVYDSQGRTASQWLGSSDTVTGTWSPSNHGSMVLQSQNVYDGGGVGDGNLTSSSDALTRTTTYEYDFRNRLTKTTLPDPDGSGTGHPLVSPVYETLYDNLGRVKKQSDGTVDGLTTLGHYTTYDYDDVNRTVTTTGRDADGSSGTTNDVPVTVVVSNSRGLTVSTTDPLNHVTTYTYDGAGRQITVTQPDPDGAGSLTSPVTQYQYDGVGNVRFVTDPLGHVTESQYDKGNRLVKTIEPDPDGLVVIHKSAPLSTRC
jgi:YD repeat-containing protein